MSNFKWWLVLFIHVFYTLNGYAEDCSLLLSKGIYDYRSSSEEQSSYRSFSQWFCDEKFSSMESANSFGATLAFPFNGVPVKLGFDSNSESWSSWYSNFCGSVNENLSSRQSIIEHTQTINPGIISAVNACIQAEGLHTWIERTNNEKEFIFAAKFVATDLRHSPDTNIVNFNVGENVRCTDKPEKIDNNVWRTRCTRIDDNPVSLFVNATNGPIRSGVLSLPSISKAKPFCEDQANGKVCGRNKKCVEHSCRIFPNSGFFTLPNGTLWFTDGDGKRCPVDDSVHREAIRHDRVVKNQRGVDDFGKVGNEWMDALPATGRCPP